MESISSNEIFFPISSYFEKVYSKPGIMKIELSIFSGTLVIFVICYLI